MPIDIALQKAKLEFIRSSSKKYQLPYFWAATILLGKDEEILIHKSFSWKEDVAALLMLWGVVFLSYRWFHVIRKRSSLSNNNRPFLSFETRSRRL